MNTFVVTVNGTTFNFTVKPGTVINIQSNDETQVIDETQIIDDKSVISSRCISDISDISEQIGSDSEIEILDTIKNITMRNPRYNEDNEFCKPVKHSYSKDVEGSYICPYCDVKKKKVNTMSEHVRTNHSSEYGRNKETYYCENGCNKGFPTKTRLEHHVKTFHAIVYEKCPHPDCSYDKAKNSSTLIQHYAKHHMDYKKMFKTENGMCICNDCGASSKTGMLYHLGVCSSASPFYKKK
jgi:hypothetical protein